MKIGLLKIRKGIGMARRKKNGIYLNVCIEAEIYGKLDHFCIEAGQTKTVAVERALAEYISRFEKKQEMLRELREGNV